MLLVTPATFNPIVAGLKLSELIGSLSHALDITEGQPEGHCVRCCWIGMHIGREIGLEERQLWELYYTLLLKDLGCSSNAARICELYLTDDLQFKRDFKRVGDSLPQVVRFVLQHTGLKAGLAERFHSVLHIFRDGTEIATELIQTRCQRGGEIARLLRFSEGIAEGIYSLDEHWNGQGKPAGLTGEAMGLSLERRRWLKRGALLHDVGKLGVSNAVLDKAGKLDAEEWKAVRQHAALTESILSRIDAFSELARVAGAHHERLDGGGYPRGLMADEITMETRIITTADIFDAITAERPYRGAVPIPQTLEMMA